jgi:hypothetical protein
VGFKPRIVKEADGAASALAFVAAGVWRGGGQRAAAEDTRQECGFPRSDSRGQRVGAAWKSDAVSASVVSRFVDILAQSCANGNGGSRASVNSRLN